jgi:hypothetical protein
MKACVKATGLTRETRFRDPVEGVPWKEGLKPPGDLMLVVDEHPPRRRQHTAGGGKPSVVEERGDVAKVLRDLLGGEDGVKPLKNESTTFGVDPPGAVDEAMPDGCDGADGPDRECSQDARRNPVCHEPNVSMTAPTSCSGPGHELLMS